MSGVRNLMNNLVHATKEKLMPTSVVSSFNETGKMTPQEFVEAGDDLVRNWPHWRWQGAVLNQKDYLPRDKQFLIANTIMSFHRYHDVHQFDSHLDTTETGEEIEVINNNDNNDNYNKSSTHPQSYGSIDAEDPLLDAFDLGVFEEDDHCTATSVRFSKYRTYTMTMTYDKVYYTPRIWLTGVDVTNTILDYNAMFEDVSPDHKGSTVTAERHPFTNDMCLSIHPCRQTEMLKRRLEGGDISSPTDAMETIVRIMTTILPTIDFVGFV